MLLAEAAADANIPYIMSGGSNASMEEAVRVAPNNTWFQLYAAKDPNLTDALIGRARDCGVGALVSDGGCAGASQARAQLAQRLCHGAQRRRSWKR